MSDAWEEEQLAAARKRPKSLFPLDEEYSASVVLLLGRVLEAIHKADEATLSAMWLESTVQMFQLERYGLLTIADNLAVDLTERGHSLLERWAARS